MNAPEQVRFQLGIYKSGLNSGSNLWFSYLTFLTSNMKFLAVVLALAVVAQV